MSNAEHVALTAERISEILDAMNAGRTVRKASAVRARLRLVLEALGRGTIAEEVARQRAAAETVRAVFGKLGLPPEQDPSLAHLASLESVAPEEERAVLAALDALEPHFPDAVRAIRLRHDRTFAARELAAASDQRTGDPGRPELTRERVAELLAVIPRIHEREPSIGVHLFRPTLPDASGKSARRIFGRRLATVVEELAGDVDAFARDLFWLHFIAMRVRGNEAIDVHLFRAREHSRTDVWKPLPRRRREMIAEEVSGVAALLERVGRSEEAVVKDAVDDVRAMIMRHRTIGKRSAR